MWTSEKIFRLGRTSGKMPRRTLCQIQDQMSDQMSILMSGRMQVSGMILEKKSDRMSEYESEYCEI